MIKIINTANGGSFSKSDLPSEVSQIIIVAKHGGSGGGQGLTKPVFFLEVEPSGDDCYVRFYDPSRAAGIRAWFQGRGYEPYTEMSDPYDHVSGVDKDTAMLAKLTWGGVNNDSAAD